MASNRLPDKLDPLLTLAADMADGMKAYEAHVGLKQNTEAGLRADLTAATDARSGYHNAVVENAGLRAALATAVSDAQAFIGTTKGVLGNFLGKQWSTAWLTAGFSKSLQIPSATPQRQSLLESLGTYLQANPDKQNPPLNVTSVRAGELLAALKSARAAVSSGNSAVSAAKALREQTAQDLRNRMGGLIAELRQLLDDDDPLWYAFGLTRPADLETPGIPTGLALTGGLPGAIHVTWVAGCRAARHRVYKKEEGDADYEAVLTTTSSEAMLTGLHSGGNVQIQVSAANDAGESKPCAPVQLIVPAAPA